MFIIDRRGMVTSAEFGAGAAAVAQLPVRLSISKVIRTAEKVDPDQMML